MKIIVHYPKNIEAQKQLHENVSAVHAQAAVNYIQKLNCPKDNKLSLLKDIHAIYSTHKKKIWMPNRSRCPLHIPNTD